MFLHLLCKKLKKVFVFFASEEAIIEGLKLKNFNKYLKFSHWRKFLPNLTQLAQKDVIFFFLWSKGGFKVHKSLKKTTSL
jgi:hypothetical protein